MTREEIIGGLQFTVAMFLFDPITGETHEEPRNNMDKTTVDACKGAIELLSQSSNEAMGAERILDIIHKEGIEDKVFKALSIWLVNDRKAQIRELAQQKATLKAIGKIANKNPNKTEALNGIKALCESELEEDKGIER